MLNKEQCGFRKNHSTLDVISTLHTNICNSLKNKRHTIVISLDIEKAYDMVWKKRVITILQSKNINGRILKYIENFLYNRSFHVKIGNIISNNYKTENGLSQGSSLSVTLFLIAINNIFEEIPKPVKSICFADDSYIYCNGNNISTTTKQLQEALDKLSDWSNKTGFIISTNKTKCIVFGRKRKLETPILKLNNSTLPTTKEIRIL